MKLPGTNICWRSSSTIILLLLLLPLTSCESTASAATHPKPTITLLRAPYAVTTELAISYGPLSDEILDLCLPNSPSPSRPGVVLIHGGGWVQGSLHDFDAICRHLASLGFVAVTISYRLAPKYIWPAQLIDAQLAVRWLRSQASQVKLDPQRICSYGISAGGHLAVFLGVLSFTYPGDEIDIPPGETSNVSCVVDEFGFTDLTGPLNTNYQRSILHALLGGATLKSNPQVYRNASPIFDVSSESAPMLIIQGTRDTIVPETQSLELQLTLQRAHVPVQYISYEGEHSFGGLDQPQRESINTQIFAYLVAQEHP